MEYSSLREGQEVEYEVGQGSNGRSEAVKVSLAEVEVKEELPSAEETTEVPEAVEEGSTEPP